MDKSFNDQELSDIMKEIEALEDDFSAVDEKLTSPVIEELANLEEDKATPVGASNIVSLDSKRDTPRAETGASTTMSFKVQGNLTLDLQFDIGGKTVSLEVTESGLTIEMEGGMKFSVPVTDKGQFKKAV